MIARPVVAAALTVVVCSVGAVLTSDSSNVMVHADDASEERVAQWSQPVVERFLRTRRVTEMHRLPGGGLVVATRSGAFVSVDGAFVPVGNLRCERRALDSTALGPTQVDQIRVDAITGEVWLTGREGDAGRFDTARGCWRNANLPDPDSLEPAIDPADAMVARDDGGGAIDRWESGSLGVQRTVSGWRSLAQFEGEVITALAIGRDDTVLIATGNGEIWELSQSSLEQRCAGGTALDATAAVSLSGASFVGTTTGLVAVDTCSPAAAAAAAADTPDPWSVRDIAVVGDTMWIASSRGLWSASVTESGELGTLRRRASATVTSVWDAGNGQVGLAGSDGWVVFEPTASNDAPTPDRKFAEVRTTAVRAGVAVGDVGVLAASSDVPPACLTRIGDPEPCGSHGENHQPTQIVGEAEGGRVWVLSDGEVFVATVDRLSDAQLIWDSTSVLTDEVNAIDVDTAGTVWLGHASGLLAFTPAVTPPEFAFVGVDVDGVPCEACRTGGPDFVVPFDASTVAFDVRGAGMDPGLRSNIQVDGCRAVADEQQPSIYKVAEGDECQVSLQLIDRFGNASDVRDLRLFVEREPFGSKVASAARSPLTYGLGLLALAAAVAAFIAWRRLGRVRLVDATWMVELHDGVPRSELSIQKSVLGRHRAPTVLHHRHAGVADITRFEVGPDSDVHRIGAELLATFAGSTGADALATALSRPTTQGVRLELSHRDEDSEQLRWLPWELIGDGAVAFTAGGLAITRQVRDASAVTRSAELRVLIAHTHVEGDPALGEFDRQIESYRTAFPTAELAVRERTTIEQIERDLAANRWDIVHLYAHGGTDDSGGFLVFASESAGRGGSPARPRVRATDLVSEGRDAALLVVVAACRTSNPDRASSPVAGFAEQLVSNGMARSAIGFSDEVAQIAIGDFVSAFVRQLSRHRQIDVAAAAGRAAISTGDRDRAAARVYGGPPDGLMYEKR